MRQKAIFILAALFLLLFVASTPDSGSSPSRPEPAHRPPPQERTVYVYPPKKADPEAELRGRILRWTVVILIVLAGLVIIAALAATAVRYLIIPAWKESQQFDPDKVLRTTHNTTDENGHKTAYTAYYRQADSFTPGAIIERNGSVKMHAALDDTAENQLHYARAKEMANAIRGNPKGLTSSHVKVMTGEAASRARLAASQARISEIKQETAERQQWAVEKPVQALLDAPALSLADALSQSGRSAWIMGQSVEDGEPLTFDIMAETHCGIIGSTGTGKTQSTGALLAIQARIHGFDVVVLDGKNGADWRHLDPHIDRHDMTAQSAPQHIDELLALYELRAQLIRKNKVSHVDELGGSNPHLLVIMEEFGRTRARMQGKAGKRVDYVMGELLSLARYTGIHICIIDQKQNDWPQSVTANINTYFAYRIKGMVAQHIESGLDRLPKMGHFQYDGEVYRAWHTVGELSAIRDRIPLMNYGILTPFTPFRDGNDGLTTNGQETQSSERKRGETGNGGGGSAQNTPLPLPLLETETVTDWHQVAIDFFADFPEGAQAELRELMAELDENRTPDSFKKLAHTLYHKYSPRGNSNQ